jgi:hypothetical protein
MDEFDLIEVRRNGQGLVYYSRLEIELSNSSAWKDCVVQHNIDAAVFEYLPLLFSSLLNCGLIWIS